MEDQNSLEVNLHFCLGVLAQKNFFPTVYFHSSLEFNFELHAFTNESIHVSFNKIMIGTSSYVHEEISTKGIVLLP